MVIDGLRGYLQLASGLTDVTRERARAAARAVVAQGGAVVPTSVQAQVSTLTDDLMATSKANRHLLVNLVRGEVERSVARMGLVSTKDMEAAERRAKGLERRVAELEEELSRSSTARKAANTRARKATAKKSSAKKTTAPAATTAAEPAATEPIETTTTTETTETTTAGS